VNLVPTVMIKNEELWIEDVLKPLSEVFDRILVADTGSIDRTVEIVRSFSNADLSLEGNQIPSGLTHVRQKLTHRARELGYSHFLLVDGDELYNRAGLRSILEQSDFSKVFGGYTSMTSLDADDDGQLWELDDQFSRLAVHPTTTTWRGDYPFELPDVFENPKKYPWVYYTTPNGQGYHGVHLHRLERSSQDDQVVYRTAKRFQFCMQDKPQIQRRDRFDLDRWRAN